MSTVQSQTQFPEQSGSPSHLHRTPRHQARVQNEAQITDSFQSVINRVVDRVNHGQLTISDIKSELALHTDSPSAVNVGYELALTYISAYWD